MFLVWNLFLINSRYVLIIRKGLWVWFSAVPDINILKLNFNLLPRNAHRILLLIFHSNRFPVATNSGDFEANHQNSNSLIRQPILFPGTRDGLIFNFNKSLIQNLVKPILSNLVCSIQTHFWCKPAGRWRIKWWASHVPEHNRIFMNINIIINDCHMLYAFMPGKCGVYCFFIVLQTIRVTGNRMCIRGWNDVETPTFAMMIRA